MQQVNLSGQHSSNEHYLQGVTPILLASILWAFAYFFRKTILADCSAVLLTFFTAAIVALILALWCRLSMVALWQTFRSHALLYIGLAFFGVAAGTTLMFAGLSHLDLGVALILEKLQPVFTIILARCFLGERPRPAQWLWICIALTAACFIAVPNPAYLQLEHSTWFGILCICGAAFSWALSTIIGRKIMLYESDALRVTLIRFLLGAIFLLPFFAFREALELRLVWSAQFVMIVVLAAVFSTAGGYILYYRGLRFVDATTATFLELATPITGTVLGYCLLGETLSPTQGLAMPVLLVAIVCIVRSK